MRVYIVTGEEYESSTILGAYSSADKAIEAQLNDKSHGPISGWSLGYGMTVVEIDAPMRNYDTEVDN